MVGFVVRSLSCTNYKTFVYIYAMINNYLCMYVCRPSRDETRVYIGVMG